MSAFNSAINNIAPPYQNPNPKPNQFFTYTTDDHQINQLPDLEFSNYLAINGGFEEEISVPNMASNVESNFNGSSNLQVHLRNAMKKNNTEEEQNRFAFRTKSKLEIMDDGFKWRKYGKKMIKTSPNPRSYFKCTSEGCSVKKTVERDGKDPDYVITTYRGMHNHNISNVHYYTDNNLQIPWTLKPASSSLH